MKQIEYVTIKNASNKMLKRMRQIGEEKDKYTKGRCLRIGFFIISPILGRLINKLIYVGVNPYVWLLNPYRGCIISVPDIRIPMTRKKPWRAVAAGQGVVLKQIMHEKGTNFN